VRRTAILLVALLLGLALSQVVRADDGWILGPASEYGPGTGVAMPFCSWNLRHAEGCGWVRIQSLQNGVTVVVRVVDFCQCYVGTADERIVDLQYGVVAAMGLERAQGLFPVQVQRVGVGPALMPDTAVTK
jgi:hypothetical protein